MTIYYIKQDNTVWGCGDPECCGEYYEEIVNDFVKCDCLPQSEMTADHLQGCNGGGPVLKWRVANEKEVLAFNAGVSEGWAKGWGDGYNSGFDKCSEVSEERIIKLLEAKADQAMRAGEGKPMPERMEYLAVETSIRQVIALIKGKSK